MSWNIHPAKLFPPAPQRHRFVCRRSAAGIRIVLNCKVTPIFRYEHKRQRLATRLVFAQRVGRSLLIGLALIGVSLAAGMAGYMYFAEASFVDAFLDAAMILGGMGPVGELHSNAAKIFAGIYALYSGLLLIVVSGIILAPLLHRVLHALHADEQE
jgi:hypothetical protein